MTDPEPTICHAASSAPVEELTRVEASTIDEVLNHLDGTEDPALLLVAVDRACDGDTDAVVALVSVLVAAGVQHIETRHVRIVQRVFDTHLAITAGQIEVLES